MEGGGGEGGEGGEREGRKGEEESFFGKSSGELLEDLRIQSELPQAPPHVT